MDKKTSLIIMFIADIISFGFLAWLILFLANKEVVGGKNLTAGLIIGLVPIIPFIGSLVSLVYGIIGLIKVCQGDLDPELPVISQWNWFDK